MLASIHRHIGVTPCVHAYSCIQDIETHICTIAHKCILPTFFFHHSSSSSLCEQRSLLSWSIARRGVCAHITCRKLVLKSASCNLKRKQEVTAKQKLCIENKGELKNPVVYIVFSRRRKESSVGEETTWSGRLFQTGIVQGKKENL